MSGIHDISPEAGMFRLIESALALDSRLTQVRHARAPLFVLLVEDDPFTRRLLSGMLSDRYRIATAATPREAIDLYLEKLPDIAFLDIEMNSEYHGIDLLRTILAHDPMAYAVMLSAHFCQENLGAAQSLGARGFIAKPFRREEMMHHLRRCETEKYGA